MSALAVARLSGYRQSYRRLAWYLNRSGYDVGPDHLGDDWRAGVALHVQANMASLQYNPTSALAGNGEEQK